MIFGGRYSDVALETTFVQGSASWWIKPLRSSTGSQGVLCGHSFWGVGWWFLFCWLFVVGLLLWLLFVVVVVVVVVVQECARNGGCFLLVHVALKFPEV